MAQWALAFDGTDDRVNVGDMVTLEPALLTLSFWAKITDPARLLNGGIVKGDLFQTGAAYSYKIEFSSGTARGGITGADNVKYGFTTPIGDSDWHLWTLTYDGTNVKFYKDATEIGSVAAPSIDYTKTRNEFTIGASAAGDYSLDGIIDEISVSDIARDSEWVALHWNGGNGIQFEVDANTVALWHMNEGVDATIFDETDNNNDGTITGASWIEGGVPFPVPVGRSYGYIIG